MDADKVVVIEFENVPILPSVAVSVDKIAVKQNEHITAMIANLDATFEDKTVAFWLNSDPVKLGEAVAVLHGEQQ